LEEEKAKCQDARLNSFGDSVREREKCADFDSKAVDAKAWAIR